MRSDAPACGSQCLAHMNQTTLRLVAPWILAGISLLSAGCSGAPVDDSDIGSSESAYSENDNEKAAFDFFVAKGLEKYKAAAIVGNLIQESGVDPSIAQYGGGPGRGIAQWSEGGRWNADHDDNVVWYAGREHESRDSLNLQLKFTWYELETFRDYGLRRLRDSGDISEATISFEQDFEGCGECDQGNRIAYAKEVLRRYGN
jgi:hypothetical protein